MSARHASTRGVKISSFEDALDLVILTDTDELTVKLSCHLIRLCVVCMVH